jgi:hypothetical protein
MTTHKRELPVFAAGEPVVLIAGTYEGTTGVFLRLKDDATWADITEHCGRVRSHPMAWLAHAEGSS